MKVFKRISSLTIFILLLILASCTQNDDQREFEKEAYRLPENITETAENGDIINDNTDPDDWRTAPFFQGVTTIYPPFPNPVLSNQRIKFEISSGLDGPSGLRILAIDNQTSLRLLYEYPSSPLPPGLTSVTLDALVIARFPENPEGIYRIVFEDLERNVISYGDIRIE